MIIHRPDIICNICTKDKRNLFWNVGAICNCQFKDSTLSNIGEIVDLEANKINSLYENVRINIRINKYVIMPNHIHLIIILSAANG